MNPLLPVFALLSFAFMNTTYANQQKIYIDGDQLEVIDSVLYLADVHHLVSVQSLFQDANGLYVNATDNNLRDYYKYASPKCGQMHGRKPSRCDNCGGPTKEQALDLHLGLISP